MCGDCGRPGFRIEVSIDAAVSATTFCSHFESGLFLLALTSLKQFNMFSKQERFPTSSILFFFCQLSSDCRYCPPVRPSSLALDHRFIRSLRSMAQSLSLAPAATPQMK